MKKPRILLADPLRSLHDNYTCQQDDATIFKGEIPLLKMISDFDKIALDATIETFTKFNWINPDIRSILKSDQEKFLKKI